MTLEEEFEEKFCKYLDFPENSLPMVRPELYTNFEPIIDWIEAKIDEAKEEGFNAGCDYTCKQYGDGKTEAQIIDEACKKAKIEECEYWREIIFSPEQQAIKPTISLTDFQLRIVELSPKEDKKYYCKDCGTEMDEGEAKTFTCCEVCWDKHYKNQSPKESNK